MTNFLFMLLVKSALDFIKVVTKILSLDLAVSNEVSALRRTLLTQVDSFDPNLYHYIFVLTIGINYRNKYRLELGSLAQIVNFQIPPSPSFFRTPFVPTAIHAGMTV